MIICLTLYSLRRDNYQSSRRIGNEGTRAGKTAYRIAEVSAKLQAQR